MENSYIRLNQLKYFSVLIVDDDVKQLESLKTILEIFFDTIYLANNGEEALEVFQSQKIDVVFSDFVMPKMDGVKLCKAIKEIDPNIPFIILSNYSEREKLLEVIPLKLVAYLIKPMKLSLILDTLNNVLTEFAIQNKLYYKINDEISYNIIEKKLISNNDDISLSKTEIVLLEYFIKYSNEYLSQEVLENLFVHDKKISYKAITNMIYRIRKKIGKDSLENVQKLGYRLKVDK